MADGGRVEISGGPRTPANRLQAYPPHLVARCVGRKRDDLEAVERPNRAAGQLPFLLHDLSPPGWVRLMAPTDRPYFNGTRPGSSSRGEELEQVPCPGSEG